MRDTAFGTWFLGLSLFLAASFAPPLRAESLDPGLIQRIQAATFEVVSAKPETDPLTYEKPLPLDLLPFQERTDKFHSIGTAFSIGGNRYVTAAHVIDPVLGGLWGPPALRDSAGAVHEIGKIEKYSRERDFVVFSLAAPIAGPGLEPDTAPALNSVVFAVGNALGSGVVARDGLYTSNTPEERDGRWNFIRFSAAASPGNSGGPLLDKNGKVIGVVLRKSPSENLNYALPIAEVLDAPDHLASADIRAVYRLTVSDVTLVGDFKTQFALPLTPADFHKEMQARYDGFLDTQSAALLAKDPANLFPNGPGAQRMLHGLSGANPYPVLIKRGEDGIWAPQAKPGPRSPLPGNGYVQGGQMDGNMMFHWRRSDTVSARDAYSGPDRLMGDLLQHGLLTRSVGAEKVKVVALGRPSADETHTDRWRRRWQVRVWPIAFGNIDLITYALPVPDGYVVMAQFAPATQLHEHLIGIGLNADFVNVSYEGTIAQWRDFLGERALLPPMFEHLKLTWSPGAAFAFASDRLSFSVPPEVQASTADSVLTLGMGFFPGPDKPVWDASVIRLRRAANDNDLLNIQRHIKPPADIGANFENLWDKVATRKHPFDGVMRVENDVSKITAVLDSPAAGESGPLYTLFLEVPGATSQDALKGKLDSWMKTFQVAEH